MTISGEAFETYVKSYTEPGAVRGAMSDYRAGGEDIAQDLEDADRKIRCPSFRFGAKTSEPLAVSST